MPHRDPPAGGGRRAWHDFFFLATFTMGSSLNGHVRDQVQVLVHPLGSARELLRAFGAAAQVPNPSVSPASGGGGPQNILRCKGALQFTTTLGSRGMAGGCAELSDSGSQGS